MDTKRLQDGETPAEYIERRIGELFEDLAEQLADAQMDADTSAGVPFELTSKCWQLQTAWRRIVTRACPDGNQARVDQN